MDWYVIGGGGGLSAGSSVFTIEGTVGQPLVVDSCSPGAAECATATGRWPAVTGRTCRATRRLTSSSAARSKTDRSIRKHPYVQGVPRSSPPVSSAGFNRRRCPGWRRPSPSRSDACTSRRTHPCIDGSDPRSCGARGTRCRTCMGHPRAWSIGDERAWPCPVSQSCRCASHRNTRRRLEVDRRPRIHRRDRAALAVRAQPFSFTRPVVESVLRRTDRIESMLLRL